MADEYTPPLRQRTDLYDWHVVNGGRMVDFAGWDLPVFYESGALAEHHVTRRSVGLFDIDHMGQIQVSGDGAESAIDHLVSSDMAGLRPGAARYGLLCNEGGGVVDDVIVYRLAPDDYMVVVNAANRKKDLDWIVAHADDAAVTDRSDVLAMMAVQGPGAVALVDAAAGGGVAGLERFTSGQIELFGASAMVGRTGYTGEDGVELYVEGDSVAVWTGLLEEAASTGVEAMAVGLSARDSLRFEPGYPLYGHELGPDITPLEARLGWAVALDGPDFIGRDALRSQKEAGLSRRLETIVLQDRGVPREGSEVLAESGEVLGTVVSGMYAPTVDVFAANVFLPRTHGAVGTPLVVDVRGRHKAATVVARPLYRSQ
jgi:glycine cleavage system T protein